MDCTSYSSFWWTTWSPWTVPATAPSGEWTTWSPWTVPATAPSGEWTTWSPWTVPATAPSGEWTTWSPWTVPATAPSGEWTTWSPWTVPATAPSGGPPGLHGLYQLQLLLVSGPPGLHGLYQLQHLLVSGPPGLHGLYQLQLLLVSGPPGLHGLYQLQLLLVSGPPGLHGLYQLQPLLVSGPPGLHGLYQLQLLLVSGPPGLHGLYQLQPLLVSGPPGLHGLYQLQLLLVDHLVSMDCTSYSSFCYRCDDFVVNDTKLGQVQKVREHLRSLENSPLAVARRTKRKLLESNSPSSKLLKDNGGASSLSATGLQNLGNTCFMNAILQSLSNIQQFSCYFKELPAVALRSGKTAGRRMYHTRSQGDTSVSLVEELRKTLCYLWHGGPTAFSPDSLFYVIWKIMPSFRGYQQHDAHEFLRYLLDHLHRELQGRLNGAKHLPPDSVKVSTDNPTLPPDGLALPLDGVKLPTTGGKCCMKGSSTVVTSIFGGVLQNEVNCLICGTESIKFDPFLDLSLDIPSQFRQKRTKDQEPGPTCTLLDCLCSFTDLEELVQSELYMCPRCEKRQKSTKKFWVRKLPKVLCLHLKRFHWTSNLRNKVTTYVEFPLRGLDMRGYLLQQEKTLPDRWLYDLAAVVVHHGSGVGSGHYTAYGRRDDRWYHFNDSTVTLTEEETVVKAKAYILFYTERPDQTTPETDTRL
ncbi:ubiquitin carboxyl-terminal hydrolase 3 isoform X2 [Coregonus clupeaformis]|uniref:ubiquitin carboxyl-terminal hydrolase 3 isoform X2 n=1 Tax=Coregonus clupeaformis TaxID=59861 RepID=UPI001E1C6FA5|nr:ubiquitin carboxyl-terminal hydrolase 3 isoform X2 [Coregonus clupeaformis]